MLDSTAELKPVTSEIFRLPHVEVSTLPFNKHELLPGQETPVSTPIVVTRFAKEYNLVSPIPPNFHPDFTLSDQQILESVPGDPFLAKRTKNYLAQITAPGGPAAGSSEGALSVIGRLGTEQHMPRESDLFDLPTRWNLLPPEYTAAVGQQFTSPLFNDGAGSAAVVEGKALVFDEPNSYLSEHGMASQAYLNFSRWFIGTTQDGQNLAGQFSSTAILKHQLLSQNISYAVFAQPLFIDGGKVLTEEQNMSGSQIADARHYICCPSIKNDHITGFFPLPELVHAFRHGRGSEIYASLRKNQPLRLDRITEGFTNDEILASLTAHPAYADPRFRGGVRFSESWIELPYLVPNRYNHMLFGLDNNRRFVTVHIPGMKMLGDKFVTGWGGLTMAEIFTWLSENQESLQLQVLWSACQGRDPGAMVTGVKAYSGWQTEYVLDNTTARKALTGVSAKYYRNYRTSPMDTLALRSR